MYAGPQAPHQHEASMIYFSVCRSMHIGRYERVHVQAYVREHTFGDQKLNWGVIPQ